MKTKSTQLSNRHPQVVMIFEKEEDISGVSAIISNNIEEYRAVPLNDDTNDFLDESKPSILIFALSSVDKCIEYYSELLAEKRLITPHFAILLCRNRESALAFRCCMKGLFDNYFIFQPLFEKLRLLMIIQNGLVQCNLKGSIEEFNHTTFEQFDDDLKKLIDQSSHCKRQLLDKIDNSKEQLSQVTAVEDDVEQPVEQTAETESNTEQLGTEPEDLLSAIKQNCVTPLLKHLEEDIKNSLDDIIQQLLEQQLAIKTAATKSKGLIHHVPSIKNREKIKAGLIVDQDNEHIEPEIIEPEASEQKSNKNKVLIVEDNALYREMLSSVLAKENFEITEAEDGLRALSIIKDNSFDLIIMDLYMPNLDGLNATKQIRQLSGGVDIPVIALTGNKNKENVKKWAHYGLKGYILKPSNKEQILKTVKAALA
ncbi:MAG: response regulator [Thalassotalea sp.]